VVLSTTTLSIHETTSAGNHSASYTVRLASRPTGTVTVSVDAGSQAAAGVASLVFNASDWSTPKAVTVTALDDLVAEANPHVGTVVHSVGSNDPADAYASLTAGTVGLSITDNDQANVAILNSSGGSPLGTLTVDESGSTAVFGVVLGSKPTANVVVVLSSSDSSEGTVSPASVAFSTSDWDQLKLVKVTGVDDRIHDGDITWQVVTAEALSSDQAYNNFNPSDVQVQTTDDDTPALATNLLGQLGTTEAGGTAVFQVALTTQPAAGSTVTVHPASSNSAEIGVSADLVFTPANWNTYQNIVLTGLDDDVDDDAQSVTITLSVVTADGARDQDYDGLTATVTATNQDDDVPAILVSATTGLTTSETGGTASFHVSLSCQPTANVTVDTSASDSSEGRIPYDHLVFTTVTDQALSIVGRTATAGWNIPIQVIATGLDDDVVDGTQSWTVTLAQAESADPDFAAINPTDVSVTNADDEIPMSATPSSLTLTEGGSDGTVTLMLLGTPSSPVTVSLSLSDFSQASLSATSVTFTAANVPQTVSISPVADGSADGPASLTLVIGAATSTDLTFDGYDLADIPITIADQDATAVRIGATTGLVTAEDGTTAITAVTLGSRPTADVVVTFTSSVPGEILPSPATMTFTTTTWNIPQDLTLTGQDDAVADGSVSVNVSVAVASADTGYDGLSVTALQASNLDDDQPAILVLPSGGSTRVAEAGSADEVAVRLASQPTGSVVVTVDPGAQLTANPATLTFTASTWNTAQTVLVRAVDDAVVEGSHTGVLALSAAGVSYDAVTATSPVQVADNDQAGIQVSPTSGIVTTEAGGTGAFTVSLTSKPAADVTIDITSSDTAEITTSVASLTFTTTDYATPRIVTLTGVQDAEDDGDQTVTITLAAAVSTDTNYSGLNPADVTATNRDDDTAAIVATPGSGLLTDEGGGTATFTVTLASQPTAAVAIAVSSTNGAEATAGPATLNFDSTSWNTPQTVTVTGQDDATADGDASFAISLQASSSDGAYASISTTLSGINQDNDTPGLLVTLPDGPWCSMRLRRRLACASGSRSARHRPRR
jgi:hypothetical protein